QGISESEVLQQYPQLQPEDIRAALLYAAQVLAHEDVFPAIAHVYSPRLADPNQQSEFQMENVEDPPGGVQPQPPRTAGLHMGAIQASDDFDEPLTGEFEGGSRVQRNRIEAWKHAE